MKWSKHALLKCSWEVKTYNTERVWLRVFIYSKKKKPFMMETGNVYETLHNAYGARLVVMALIEKILMPKYWTWCKHVLYMCFSIDARHFLTLLLLRNQLTVHLYIYFPVEMIRLKNTGFTKYCLTSVCVMHKRISIYLYIKIKHVKISSSVRIKHKRLRNKQFVQVCTNF